jgi:hypothetical protein
MTGLPGRDGQDRGAGIGQSAHGCSDKTAWAEEKGEGSKKKEQPEQDIQSGTPRMREAGQIRQNKTARTGLTA